MINGTVFVEGVRRKPGRSKYSFTRRKHHPWIERRFVRDGERSTNNGTFVSSDERVITAGDRIISERAERYRLYNDLSIERVSSPSIIPYVRMNLNKKR